MKTKLGTDKFAELVLYISKACANDPDFGATKLNKILFFSDFRSYRMAHKGISGATYQKLDHGPAPKCLLPVQNALIKGKSLAIEEVARYGKTQKRPVALREPDVSGFSAEEIALVNEVIRDLSGKNASDVSELSHRFWYDIAKSKEEIPLQVSLVDIPDDVSDSERRHAKFLEPTAAKLIAA